VVISVVETSSGSPLALALGIKEIASMPAFHRPFLIASNFNIATREFSSAKVSFYCTLRLPSIPTNTVLCLLLTLGAMSSSNDLQLSIPATVSRFPQQGQLDWVSFGNAMYSMSAAVLQRFSNSHIQPATYAAGRSLASRLKMGEMGEKRMNDAIENIRGIPGLDGILYFGFGYQSFVKLLAQDLKGLELVALCGCLCEVHSETMAAWILRDLWSIEGFPDNYKPPQSQFIGLAKSCSGVVSRTSFGVTMAEMHREAWTGRSRPDIMVSPSIDVARALNGLFKISRGEVASIHVVGRSECAFIAGLAQWLFDFTVYVENENGKLVYTNTAENEVAQVNVRYADDLTRAERQGIQILNTTYILGSHHEMMVHTPDTSLLKLSLRVPWESCISQVLGRETFSRLLQNSRTVGGLLGTMARLYTALAKGDTTWPAGVWPHGQQFPYIPESTHGRGFINGLTTCLSELSNAPELVSSMEAAVRATLSEANQNIEFNLRSLKSLCACVFCEPMRLTRLTDCLVSSCFAIYHLVRIMMCVNYDQCLHPTLSGLREIEKQCSLIWVDYTNSSKEDIYTCLHRILNLNGNTRLEPGENMTGTSPVLGYAFLVFTGSWPKTLRDRDDRESSCTAISSSGICVYADWLRQPSAEAEASSKIHAIPGHIEWQAKQYDLVFDGIYSDRLNPKVPEALYEAATDEIPQDPPRPEKITLKALVNERSSERELAYFYQASFPDGKVWMQPGFLSNVILHSSGYIPCNKSTCPSSLLWPCTFVQQGWELNRDFYDKLHYQNGIACCVWSFQQDLAKCTALSLLSRSQAQGKRTLMMWMRSGECIPCCLKFVLGIQHTLIGEAVIHII
jgi:hypothetical protein